VGRGALALEQLRRAGLDLALGGHAHLGYTAVAEGIVVAHAGTAVSSRLVGEANGFNLIVGDQLALAVEHWRWEEQAYVPVSRVRFERGNAGWREVPNIL